MKDLKVSKKLTISYAIILTLLIMSCVVSIVDFIRLGGQIETFYVMLSLTNFLLNASLCTVSFESA